MDGSSEDAEARRSRFLFLLETISQRQDVAVVLIFDDENEDYLDEIAFKQHSASFPLL